MTPLSARVQAVLRLAEKATPGPWTYDEDEDNWHIQSEGAGSHICVVSEPGDFPCLEEEDAEQCAEECAANRAFIASAPTMASLLREQMDELAKKEARVKELEAALRKYGMHARSCACAAGGFKTPWMPSDVEDCDCGLSAALSPKESER
jgi:hypothetical protein